MAMNMLVAIALMTSAVQGGTSGAAAQAAAAPAAPAPVTGASGVVRIKSAHGVAETVERIKTALASKGIRFFAAIDQAQLASEAKLALTPSTLVLFGNPPLGVQFLQANRYAGLDWPVRMLVVQEADGSVSIAWTKFDWIKQRYGLKARDAQIKMANEVATSIAVEAAS